MTITGTMVNGHGIAHGGYVFLLADTAFAFACNTYDVATVAAAADVVFVAPAREGDELVAEAAERVRFGRSGVYDVTVRGPGGAVVAEFRGNSRALPLSGRRAMNNPRREAWDLLGGEYDVRVLEPSPPAVAEPPWFADDPLAGPYGTKIVTPVDGLGRTWDDLARERPEIAEFCADRWLGAWRRLAPLPPAFTGTRRAAHALAEHVVAGGAQGGQRQDRVEVHPAWVRHAVLRGRAAGARRGGAAGGRRGGVQPATLGEAATLAGVRLGMPPDVYEPSTPAAPDTHLRLNTAAAGALGAWFGFAWAVLEQLRFDARAPGRVQLWPEHFDPAVDLGEEGHRASFGASPGDDAHPEPYLYVAPWEKQAGVFWNDTVFGGASLPYAALLAADDQRRTALEFFHAGLRELNS